MIKLNVMNNMFTNIGDALGATPLVSLILIGVAVCIAIGSAILKNVYGENGEAIEKEAAEKEPEPAQEIKTEPEPKITKEPEPAQEIKTEPEPAQEIKTEPEPKITKESVKGENKLKKKDMSDAKLLSLENINNAKNKNTSLKL